MTTKHDVSLGITLLALVWTEPSLATAPPHVCDSIHAVQIAVEEGLANCDTATLSKLVGKASGGPRAALADPSWHDDCVGSTANACAALHRARPERTLTSLGGGDMTVVFPRTSEQCTDGTRPAYYYARGSGAGANRWVIFLNGSSGKCGAGVDREAGEVRPFGERCFDNIVSGEADTSFLLRGAKDAGGILSASPRNRFADWNRVHIPSCSNDQYQGQRIHHDILVESVRGRDYSADVFSRGHLIVRDVLSDLANNETFAAAEQVILNGASGGAEGLIMTLDSLADHARRLLELNPDAPIVGLIDSRGTEPSVENSEATFDDPSITCSSVFAADCNGLGFDDPPRGTDLSGFGFDLTAYRPHSPDHPTWGGVYEKLHGWSSALDAECLAVHGAQSARCQDATHVLFNHLKTPVFIAASISDSNQWNNPIEFLAQDQATTTWQAVDCADPTGERYIEHARNQIVSYVRDRDNVAGGADGESHGRAPVGVWAPQIWDHVFSQDLCKFSSLSVAGVSLADAFSRWLDGNAVALIDGYRGATTGTECGVPQPRCPVSLSLDRVWQPSLRGQATGLARR
jgi:hypothetical protein